MKRFVPFATLVALTTLPTALYAYSDHELHAIYLQMELNKTIQCGMTEEFLDQKYEACKSGKCETPWVSEDGKCTDHLTIEFTGDPAPKITLNGKTFRARAVAIPGVTDKKQ